MPQVGFTLLWGVWHAMQSACLPVLPAMALDWALWHLAQIAIGVVGAACGLWQPLQLCPLKIGWAAFSPWHSPQFFGFPGECRLWQVWQLWWAGGCQLFAPADSFLWQLLHVGPPVFDKCGEWQVVQASCLPVISGTAV